MIEQTTTNALAAIEKMDLAALYGEEGGVQRALTRIEEYVRGLTFDPTSKEGQKEIVSMAYLISRAKTAVDKEGKRLGDSARARVSELNAIRNEAKTRLDALRDEVRRPVTEMEEREKARIAEHQAALLSLEGFRVMGSTMAVEAASLEGIDKALAEVESIFTGRAWHEFEGEAQRMKGEAVASLEGMKARVEVYTRQREEAQRAEAERQAEERKRREAEIARRAAEEAEQRARAEEQRKAAEAAAAVERERRAQEEQRIRQEQRAKAEAEAARRKAEAEREAQERAARDIEHQRFVNRAAAEALAALGFELTDAVKIVTALAKGEIPHVKIDYEGAL